MCKPNIFKSVVVFVTLLIITIFHSVAANPVGPYFGEIPPGDTAKVFAPNFISRPDWWVQNCCFSSDGREFIFCLTDKDWGNCRIMYTNCFNNNEWSEPVKIIDNAIVPYFSYDDQEIYCISYQRNGTSTADVWKSARSADGWGEPVRVEAPVSAPDGHEWEVAAPADNILYFSSDRPGGFGNMDVYRSVLVDGKYMVAENLGVPINTASLDECPWVAPDESYMVFNSWKTNPKFAGNNLYISWRNADSTWTNPKDLGAAVNTNYLDIYPYISPDGKYLFYTIRKIAYGGSEPSKLYWISTDFLHKMRSTNFPPYLKGAIEPVNVFKDAEFSFQIPDSIFHDDDGDTLSYILTKSSGSTPDWLHFDPVTRILSGTPPKVEKIWLRVTAADPSGEKCSCLFRLIIEVGSNVAQDNKTPRRYSLGQNYPNPFNPETTVPFIISNTCHVMMKVFNCHGQLVRTLINGIMAAGNYAVTWNGADDEGLPVSTGMYLLQFTTGNVHELQKMLLIR
ncbi:MAG TPA: putative Ig domain-containing protein [bacterium]|nr:putative Ig domain-containing protein [bacterium]HPN43327.1 putative Ig domain-containing protein [bacterium]